MAERKKHRRRTRLRPTHVWTSLVRFLTILVVFCTTYVLIMPAVTVGDGDTEETGIHVEESTAEPESTAETETVSLNTDSPENTADTGQNSEDSDYTVSSADPAQSEGTESEEPSESQVTADNNIPAENTAETQQETILEEQPQALLPLTFDGDDYHVTLTYDETAGIPENAYLSVTEITTDNEQYAELLSSARKALNIAEDEPLPQQMARFFDITILDPDNNEITVQSGVTVSIAYDTPVAVGEPEDANVVHFDHEQEEPTVMDVNPESTEEGTVDTVSFETDSFSIYGVIYTVDFRYGEYQYSMEGGTSILLSQLFTSLGITQSAADVTTIEVSNDTLISVQQAENDWSLTSLQPFTTQETLTVYFNDGGYLIIDVSDAQKYPIHLRMNDTEAAVLTSGYFGTAGSGTSFDGQSKSSNAETQTATLNNKVGWKLKDKTKYRFVTWIMNNQDAVDELTTAYPTFSGETTFDAYFAPVDAKLIRYQSAGHGSVTAGKSFESYEAGTGVVTRYYGYSSDITGATAVPDEGYVFDHWGYGESSTYDRKTFKPSLATSDMVVTAYFREEQDVTITYSALQPGSVTGYGLLTDSGIVNKIVETVKEGESAVGATAVGNNTNRFFAAWIDKNTNQIVSTNAEFKPSGNQIYANAEYVALFTVNTGDYQFVAYLNDPSYGNLSSTGNDTGMDKIIAYHFKDSNPPSLHYGIVAKATSADYQFAYWLLNGEKISTSVKKEGGLDKTTLSGNTVVNANKDKLNLLEAVFKPTNSILIQYVAGDGGTVSNSADLLSADNSPAGATAEPNSKHTFAGWYNDGKLFSTKLTLEAVDLARLTEDTTLTAKFNTGRPDLKSFRVEIYPSDGAYGNLKSTYFSDAKVESGLGTSYPLTEKTYEKGAYTADGNNTRLHYGFTPKPADGYRFAFWLDNNGNYYSALSNTTVVPADQTVFTGYFAEVNNYLALFKTDGMSTSTLVSSDDQKSSYTAYAYSTETDKTITAIPAAGYVFAGWWDQNGNLLQMTPVFDASSITRDMVLTARFAAETAGNQGMYIYAEDGGTVKAQNGSSALDDNYVALYDGKLHINVEAEPMPGYSFYQWKLVRGGQTSVLNYSSSILNKDDPDLYFNNDDKLYAVFRQATEIKGNGSATSSYTISDTKKKELQQWLNSLINGDPVTADKTAAVYGDNYANRIYQIDIDASSAVKDLAGTMDVAFILDASNSMKFPAELKRVKDASTGNDLSSVVLTQSSLNDVVDASGMSGPFYIISNPSGTAKVYRIFKNTEDNKWYYIDASYADTDAEMLSWNGSEQYDEPSETYSPPFSYPIYYTDQPVTDRLSHLNNSTKTMIDSMQDILGMVSKYGGTTGNIRVAYDTFNKEKGVWQDFTTLEANNTVSVEVNNTGGGTRQDIGIKEARKFSWTDKTGRSDVKQYAILITDGASVRSSNTSMTTAEIQEQVRTQAQGIKDDGRTLITIGLSTEDVEGGSQLLKEIASVDPATNQSLFFESESAYDLKYILLNVLQTIMTERAVTGDVTDTIDPVFYPVTADGHAIEAATSDGKTIYYDENDQVISTDISQYTGPYYYWTVNDGTWTITWKDQIIGTNTAKWHKSILVKAKEDFLGGNTMPTNTTDAAVRVDYTEDGVNKQQSVSLDTPYVNVDELSTSGNTTKWTVYLGTEVDPAEQLKKLYNSITINEVVTKSDSDYRIASDGAMAAGGSNAETFLLKNVISISDTDWGNLINDKTLTLPYGTDTTGGKIYGHSGIGTLKLELKPEYKDKEPTIDISPHKTEVTGTDVEKYTLTVTYTPADEKTVTTDGKSLDYHTTANGSRGEKTGQIVSTNVHSIDVFADKLSIEKTDNANPAKTITSDTAKFKLYRKVPENEKTETLMVNGTTVPVVQVGGELETANGFVKVSDLPYGEGGTLYLVETKAPNGYYMLSEPVVMVLNLSDAYTDLSRTTIDVADISTQPYNWTQTIDTGQTLSYSGDKKAAYDATNNLLSIQVPNNPGYILPNTGGIGTKGIYGAGTGLIALAVILYLYRKRGGSP